MVNLAFPISDDGDSSLLAAHARILGVILNNLMLLYSHIQLVWKSSWLYLKKMQNLSYGYEPSALACVYLWSFTFSLHPEWSFSNKSKVTVWVLLHSKLLWFKFHSGPQSLHDLFLPPPFTFLFFYSPFTSFGPLILFGQGSGLFVFVYIILKRQVLWFLAIPAPHCLTPA